MVFIRKKRATDSFKRTSIAYEETKPIFSFKDFKKDTEYYTKEDSNSDKNSLWSFLSAAKDFCNLRWREIKRGEQFHAHAVNKLSLKLNHTEHYDLFQFKLPNHDRGRFIGYFDNNCVFCILIYDRKHQIYPRK
jgi:hypothetical protein